MLRDELQRYFIEMNMAGVRQTALDLEPTVSVVLIDVQLAFRHDAFQIMGADFGEEPPPFPLDVLGVKQPFAAARLSQDLHKLNRFEAQFSSSIRRLHSLHHLGSASLADDVVPPTGDGPKTASAGQAGTPWPSGIRGVPRCVRHPKLATGAEGAARRDLPE